jgi:trigger factor
MPKIQHQGYDSQIKYVLDYFIEPTEYTTWVAKVRDQFLKSVEVQGFRKGKAPEAIVLKQVNTDALNNSIYQETLDKYTTEAVEIIQKQLTSDKRTPLIQTFAIDFDRTKEQEGGFLIAISVELLPEIDLSNVKDLKFAKAVEKDLADRISLSDYIEKEKTGYIANHTTYEPTEDKAEKMYQVVLDMTGEVDGEKEPKLDATDMIATIGGGSFLPDFEKGIKGVKKGEAKSFDVEFPLNYFEPGLAGKKAVFSINVKEVRSPKFLKFEDIVTNQKPEDHHGHNHPSFTTEKEFDEYVTNFYTDETNRMITDRTQKNVIKSLVDGIPSFPLPQDKIDAETNRIYSVIEQDALQTKKSIADVFAQTDLPGSKEKTSKNEDVRKKITDYVTSEFKLAAIWNVIYEQQVNQKISAEMLDQATKEVGYNPSAYGLDPEMNEQDLKENVFALLKKQAASKWLYNEVGLV